jgi:hypothetical protein
VKQFKNDSMVLLSSIFSFIVCISIYYFVFAQNTQVFSTDEQQSLFKFHVINLNKIKKLKQRGGAKSNKKSN